MKVRLSAALAASFAAVALFSDPLSASHSWGGYHWARTANPFTLAVGDNVSAAWDSVLNTTIADWSQSSVLNMVKVPGGANPKNCRPTAGRVEVCNSTYGNNGWLGIAQIWASGGHITQGVTKLNDTYFNTARYNTTAWRNLVSCQEVGHDIGLAHQDENFDNSNLNTCMDYTSNPESNQHPNAHDYALLESIYAHLDSTTTVGQLFVAPSRAASPAVDADSPAQWGRLTSSSRDGRSQTFERDLGGNQRILTHVTWAEGRAPRGREE